MFTQNAKLHIAEIIIEKDAYGARAGPAGAARVGVSADFTGVDEQYINWHITPTFHGGASIHMADAGVAGGGFYQDGLGEVWVSGGEITNQTYSIRAYCAKNTNIFDTATVRVVNPSVSISVAKAHVDLMEANTFSATVEPADFFQGGQLSV